MARKLVTSGHVIVNIKGGVLFAVTTDQYHQPVVTNVTNVVNHFGAVVQNPAITALNNNHTHYEFGTFQSIGVNAPVWDANGTLWQLTSTHPPGVHIWPYGYQTLMLQTNNPGLGHAQIGTMQTSNTGNSVYLAKNLCCWIPAAAFTGPAALPTTNTAWDVGF